jgi:hypothetical protein|nr:MAG TPA: PROTEIN THO1 BINDING PROTEIN, SAP [Caudoviricetes sp.]
MKRTDLEAMKVAELKKLTKEHGLTLESKGHKFNKKELIDRLVTLKDITEETKTEDPVKDFENLANKVSVVSDEEEAWDEPLTQENKEAAKQEGIETKEEENKRPVPGDSDYIKFATTLQEIETKYGHEKQAYVYDNMLKVGSFVVFIHYVEAKDGNVYKKLRTAKVIGVNRNKKLVRVETPMKAIMELTFEELLYIREDTLESSYPNDIRKYMKQQRERRASHESGRTN